MPRPDKQGTGHDAQKSAIAQPRAWRRGLTCSNAGDSPMRRRGICMRNTTVGDADPLRRWLRLKSDAERMPNRAQAHRRTDWEAALAQTVILVLGSPRSGTTWLAKILDSHPDVIYRHEPDEYLPPVPGKDSRAQIQAWIDARELRVATKKPFFQKSWQSPPLAMLRQTLAATLTGVSRLPIGGPVLAPALARVRVPDFA